MRTKNVPVWNGEFCPVYANEHTDPDEANTNQSRYGVLQEQLNIYAESDTRVNLVVQGHRIPGDGVR